MIKANKKGFTIIEVILVLAIAALIFLMVFLALPALQRSQRDTQRKDDIGKMIAAWTEFVGNNRGSQPRLTTGAADGSCDGAREPEEQYCDLDPYVDLSDGMTYTINDAPQVGTIIHQNNALPGATTDNIALYKRARCDVNGSIKRGDSARQIAAVVRLEGGGATGADVYYCREG